ncbi:hypothetical protein [Streptomyces phytophilus]|uniref:hypothetical protein n=1 Tax=Streptomyces phytophilus TaxID=722715 RepID=UPI0015F0C462|nr:hypothetical protein [Streptomyces phytophilus]
MSIMRPAVDVSLRFGFTLAQINRMAMYAVHRHRGNHFAHIDERFDIAWSAMVEFIYASETRPEPNEVIGAGWRALSEDIEKVRRAHGLDPRYKIEGVRAGFQSYWNAFSSSTQSHEERVVERRALWEIWQVMHPFHRKVLGTVAAHGGDYNRAAASLGKSREQFKYHLGEARRSFLELWHQGETPSRMWAHHSQHGEGYSPVKIMANMRAKKRRQAQRSPTPAKKRGRPKAELGISNEELARRYERESASSIAASLGCATSTITSRLEEIGMQRRAVGTQPPNVPRGRDLGITDEEIARRYEHESAGAIAASLGCHETTIIRRLKEMGIQRRSPGTKPPKAAPCP